MVKKLCHAVLFICIYAHATFTKILFSLASKTEILNCCRCRYLKLISKEQRSIGFKVETS